MNGFCAEMTTPASPDWVHRDLPRLPEKERHRNPPCTFESSFSNTLSKDVTNGDKPPLFFPSLVCCCFVPARRKVGRGKGDGGGERRRGEKLLALPGSEWPFIKGGLFLKTAADGWKRSQDAQFPKKSLNRSHILTNLKSGKILRPKGSEGTRKEACIFPDEYIGKEFSYFLIFLKIKLRKSPLADLIFLRFSQYANSCDNK